jgi:hypothetical protein
MRQVNGALLEVSGRPRCFCGCGRASSPWACGGTRPGPATGRCWVGQAAYIYRGGVTFVQIKRLLAAPPALTREPAAPGQPVSRAAVPRPTGGEPPAAPPAGTEPASPIPDAGAVLDEAFGNETG